MANSNPKNNRFSSKTKKERPKEKVDLNPSDYAFYFGVRYTKATITDKFFTNENNFKAGEAVIVKTCSGLEYGTICSTALDNTPETDTDKESIIGYIDRKATSSDKNILNHIRTQKEPEELEFCKQRIRERNMKMKLVNVEHIFSGEKVIFYFLADGRVDFRELVKDLARRYHTRIEMRQIGVRDEARMLSDYEHCGRELCCRTFMHDLDPVTMRMAKMQKSTLDPNKISGPCGRLMCCLRFEDEVYKDHKSQLPRKGDIITTDEHRGRVLSSQILNKKITIATDGGCIETIDFAQVTKIEANPNRQQNPKQQCEHVANCPIKQSHEASQNKAEAAKTAKAPDQAEQIDKHDPESDNTANDTK